MDTYEKGVTSLPSTPRSRRKSLLLAIVAGTLFAAAWFAGLGARDLSHPDEGRYAEIPREMAATGDWITPHLDGLKYFEKPPLQYWITAEAFELLGAGNGPARIWPALTGLLSVAWVAFVGRRLFGKAAGAFAAIVLGSGLLWVGMGHILTLDMGFSACLAFFLGSLAIAQTHRDEPRPRRAWMLAAWVALAAAVLSKGPAAIVLAGGSLAIYAVWQRDRGLVRSLSLLPGLALFLLLTVPWFAVVGVRNPGFTQFFFVHEHLDRFATNEAGRVHPWWTFLVVIVFGSAPWIVTSIGAIFRPGFGRRSERGGFDPVRLLWVWGAFTVVFFSISRSKLIPYVLPAFPALALLAGRRLAERPLVRADGIAAILIGIALLVLATVPGVLPIREATSDVVLFHAPYVLGAATLFLAGGIVATFLRRGIRPAAVLAGTSLCAALLLLFGATHQPRSTIMRRIANAIRAGIPADAPVYCVERYDQSLPFYLGRTVDLVGTRGELAFGLAEQPQREIGDLDTFAATWRNLDQAAALVPREERASLEKLGMPMRTLYEDARVVAVARR